MSELIKIKRADASEDGHNFFGGFFEDGTSPFWVTEERAALISQEDAERITQRYGYKFGNQGNDRRKQILHNMKNGVISKQEAVEALRSLTP